jgi:hypothetical protein
MNKSIKKICIVCGREFECYPKREKGRMSRHHSLGKNCSVRYKRPTKSVTCSKKCFHIYTNNK